MYFDTDGIKKALKDNKLSRCFSGYPRQAHNFTTRYRYIR